ncbi:uncharacterized protein LOC143462368 [Clavelina lepadiformis]|uniref:uncharacterized protein LOC143462368 n=1 Tax=Clavelina lepadiformis TaxID=159417 RepID=UPI004040EAF4
MKVFKTPKNMLEIVSPRQGETSSNASRGVGKAQRFVSVNRRSKLCCVFALLGLVMLIMGCIVHIEKNALEKENGGESSRYTNIAGNVLVALGVTFVLLCILHFFRCCCLGHGQKSDSRTSREEGNRNDTRIFRSSVPTFIVHRYTAPPMNTPSGNGLRHNSSISTVSELTEDEPPSYSDIIKNAEDVFPPCYYDVINEVTLW